MTKLLVLASPHTLEVFGDPVAQARICERTLSSWQESVATTAGLELALVDRVDGHPPPYFTMAGDLFLTGRFLAEFAQRARVLACNCQAGVVRNPVVDRLFCTQPTPRADGGYLLGLRYVVDPEAPPGHPLLLVMDDLGRLALRLPKAVNPHGSGILPFTTKAAAHLRAPFHVWQANMHANLAARAERMPPARLAKGPVDVRDPATRQRWNKVGPGCDIHPTAWVECCELGEGVTVGANAVCASSVLGAGAQVMEGAFVSASVVGACSMVGQHYRVVMSVIYPESFVTSGALQFSIMGRESAVYAAWITDARMDHQHVSTVVDGRVVSSGQDYLGCILGHRARLTAGVITAPGRVIPNDALVYPDPHQVLTRFPPDQPAGVPFFLGAGTGTRGDGP
jgi:acetyltransferase-like isoleucine patch superfamily enzyme